MMSDRKKYTLYYFSIRGRAELSRLVFAYAGIEYEDKRLTMEEWLKFKPTTPLGKMPVLKVDGQMIPESMAIARYLAREYGLYGQDNMQQARVDVVLDTCCDLIVEMVKFWFEKDEEIKKPKEEKFYKEILPSFCKLFEKILKDNGSTGYFVGSTLTVADLSVYALLTTLSKALELSDQLASHHQLIGQQPNIQKYVSQRPKTDL